MHQIKCKQDLPIHLRAPRSFLLGLRWQLAQWGFAKKGIKVVDEDMIMTVGGAPVLRASANQDHIKVEWLDEAWGTWEELHKSNEYKSLLATANEMMRRAADNKGKGKGKGPRTE